MADIDKLLQGYRDFYKKHFEVDNSLYKDLSTLGQDPKTLVISCSDSRSDPTIITSAAAGDIFAVRNVANLVPPYQPDSETLHGVSAALEFAVRYLSIENIIILGHSNCAGIKALVDEETSENRSTFIHSWVRIAKKAREIALKEGGDTYHICEKEGIHVSLDNLMTFPWIEKRVEAGTLKLYGWYFSINDGSLSQYNAESGNFEAITTSAP